MPTTRPVSKLQPSPTSLDQQNNFTFPNNAHLLITTPGHVFSWDASGVHTIFRSSKNGIVAAREAKDGSGVLAVADKQVVVLHDTKRGQERSWGLQADDDEVRHLAYTKDAKSLFLSTKSTADIQRYSAEQSKLLSPTRAHASPPVALAVSPTDHLMVSASDNPPTIYLSNLMHNSPPILIESRASEAAVTVITFHPERPNIFLLAFADGTAAAFDATKIARKQTGAYANQESVNHGEIGHFAKLHRPTTATHKTVCIEDAAFLPGYQSRAVTVGRDGKCRLVDFADGGVVLRTWHAQAPVTSVSVLPRKASVSGLATGHPSRRSAGAREPSAYTENLIAVGRVDGVIQIYDSLGLLLEQKLLRGSCNKVIGVEWVQGKSPKQISNTIVARAVDKLPELNKGSTLGQAAWSGTPSTQPAPTQSHKPTALEHLGLPPALRKPGMANDRSGGAARRFTIHPDEVDESTVRHTPLPASLQPPPIRQRQYLDLFSPVKPTAASKDESEMKRVTSPTRSRPQVSSQNFVKRPEPETAAPSVDVAPPRNIGLFPSTDSGNSFPTADCQATPKPIRQAVGKPLSGKPKSQRNAKMAGQPSAQAPAVSSTNAKILAELRKLSATQHPQQASGVLARYSTSHPPATHDTAPKKKGKHHLFHRATAHVETDLDSLHAMRQYEETHGKHGWPKDSHQGSSLDDDIWLTSDTERDAALKRSRRRRPVDRPPARQTSRSRVDTNGTMSTVQQPTIKSPPKPVKGSAAVDGSTDEDLWTATTYLSPDGTFSPSSKDIQRLFPRTSSLSPKKHQSSRKRGHRSPLHRKAPVLHEVPVNAVSNGYRKSPWARAKAGVMVAQAAQVEDDAHGLGLGAAVDEPHCSFCDSTRNKVHDLEGEVARLKGEVLALKATLRRNGVVAPQRGGRIAS
ncbi:uncharacterized protein LTR77_003716 [Saxophila tyrrhenica]|uniref:WD40 repeat-like protein n=1 Tax=Saxophila tyrrhenica TaxID=1690608 RepID=A0AAV9PHX6_9PEZI|nr:hypothetical protein LTR77_003716 [Saxophila tyrrhenica]